MLPFLPRRGSVANTLEDEEDEHVRLLSHVGDWQLVLLLPLLMLRVRARVALGCASSG